MKMIIFVRTAPYLYRFPEKSLYQSLDEISLQKTQPHILRPTTQVRGVVNLILEKYKPDRVFCSRLLRSQETAKLFSKNIEIISELDEIKFSMHDFSNPDELPNDEFNLRRINRIRYNFSRALIDNKLYEKKESIVKRITGFVNIFDGLIDPQTILCCSHGFIMKLYENFFRCGGKIDNFESLVSLHDWTRPPFPFLNGFVVFSSFQSKFSALVQCF